MMVNILGSLYFLTAVTVLMFYCGSDVGVGFAQLLPQALRQGRHRILGGAVEMCVCTVNNTMSAHAATENM